MKFNKILFAIVIVTAFNAFGQPEKPARGSQFGSSFSISEIEAINLTNGNLSLNFALAGLPSGRGSNEGAINLTYDSKLMDPRTVEINNTLGEPTSQDILASSNEGGWRYTSSYSTSLTNRIDEIGGVVPCESGEGEYRKNAYIWKLRMFMPDGSVKDFRPTASRDVFGDNYFDIDPNGYRRWTQITNIGSGPSCIFGETLETTAPMTYYSTDGYLRLVVEHTSNGPGTVGPWTLSFPDGRIVTGGGSQPTRTHDSNGNYIEHYGTSVVDQFGRSVVLQSSTGVPDEHWIIARGLGDQELKWRIRWKWIQVRDKQYRTSPSSGGRTRGEESAQVFEADLRVVDEIILPIQMGGQSFRFEYNTEQNNSFGWGELSEIILPSGARSQYEYALDGVQTAPNGQLLTTRSVLRNSVKKKTLLHNAVYDGSSVPVSEIWNYEITSNWSQVVEPDGSVISQTHVESDASSQMKGLVVKTESSDGRKVENLWALNTPHWANHLNGYGLSFPVNRYLKSEFTSIKDSTGAYTQTSIKDYSYDKNGNITKSTEYDFLPYSSIPRDGQGRPTGIPVGISPSRITETVYYNPTENASDFSSNSPNAYWNGSSPNLRGLAAMKEVKNSSGDVVARTELFYDGGSAIPTNGNLTETRLWDSTKGALASPDGNGFRLNSGNSISTSATYNAFGMPLTTTDANGTVTQITYGSISTGSGTVSDLYPTQTVAAYGTSLARTSTATYDFHTGAVLTTTDVDNGVTNATEYDDLGRPVKAITAQGTALESWTTTEYDDVNRRVVVRSDLETVGDGKKVATQFFDQLGRVRLSKTLEDSATQSPYNETDGIKVQTRYGYHSGSPSSYNGTYTLTSNPYRAATSSAASSEETMGWTVAYENRSGNKKTTEMFSGAALPSLWGGNTNSTGKNEEVEERNATTTTDETGKKRRTVEDALGRLIRVDEPDANGNLGSLENPNQPTHYSYDTLGNLTQIVQGEQTRTFTYSSMSRLLTNTNPESGTFEFTYDPNGNLLTKKDARNVITTYTYDAQNRVTFRDYSDSTPDVTYTYDDSQVPFSKGKLTKIQSSVSTAEITGYDAADRITASKQTTAGQVYSFGYIYSLAGALISQTYPSGKVVEYDYDASGDLSMVAKQFGSNDLFVYANSFEYAPHGQVASVRLGNGIWESTKFNGSRQITQVGLGHSAADTGLWKINYEYGEWEGQTLNAQRNNGNLARQTITVPTIGTATGFTAVQTYSYDSLDRLKSAAETIGGNLTWKQTFLYDRFGNKNFDTGNTTLQSSESAVAKITNPEILASNNKFKEDQDGDSQPDYLYDLSGNVTKNARDQYFTYDAENRQITATGTGLATNYSYDPNGKRVKSHDGLNGQTTIFVYDAESKLAAEYTIGVPAPTVPTISYLTEDALGSVRVTTNSFGEVNARRDFLPFGEELFAGLAERNANQKYSSTTDDTRKKFATYQRDIETGLDFAQSRYYSPMHGRFTSPDEFKGGPDELFDFEEDASDNPTFYADLTNPQSLNKYQYGYNNPYKYNDPSGHCPFCVAAVAGAVVFILSNPTPIGPRPKQTRAEAVADIAGILPIPGSKYVGGLVGKILTKGAAKAASTPAVKQAVGAAVEKSGKGMQNPKVAKAAAEGRKRHAELKTKVKKKEGWKSEPALKDPKTGQTVKPDVLTKSGRPLEYKPKTPSGIEKGKRQLPAQERAAGKRGRVIYYEP